MPQITFIDPSATAQTIETRVGTSLMQAAVTNDVAGITAECGGACACATCHVYVEDDWMNIVGPPGASEADMLEFASDVRSNSRLSCQIMVTDEMDGLVVRTPAKQG